MKPNPSHENIEALMKKVLASYEERTGKHIEPNTTPENYTELAEVLSVISNQLPDTAEEKRHRHYPLKRDVRKNPLPVQYVISKRQLADATTGKTNLNPRDYFVDTCYIYVYGVGKMGYDEQKQQAPGVSDNTQPTTDEELINARKETEAVYSRIALQQEEIRKIQDDSKKTIQKQQRFIRAGLVVSTVVVLLTLFGWYNQKRSSDSLRKDMSILPYRPTLDEISRLEGIWLCYTGSPQARASNPSRYHLFVCNVVDVRYKEGYFTFNRYGARFDHKGYMQYEAPGLVSIYSRVTNSADTIQSPRHSLMQLFAKDSFTSVISASWSFDAENKNQIIGIREVYSKQGKGGSVHVVFNETESSSCDCKIVEWHRPDSSTTRFYLKNQLLDTANSTLKKLLDENSILLRVPQKGLIISDTTGLKKPSL